MEKTASGEGELVLFIASDARRRGFGTAAAWSPLRAAAHTVFAMLLAVCPPSKEASVRIMRRLGFVEAGLDAACEALHFRRPPAEC